MQRRPASANPSEHALRAALRRRGLVWRKVVHNGCLAPRPAVARDGFYDLMRHYSFRLFLRDVIRHRDDLRVEYLGRYCSADVARRYLDWLRAHRMVRQVGRFSRLVLDTPSFGPTLEWFVAAVLERELGMATAWNVRLDGTATGGDYDVIAFAEATLVYVETKSSPPRNIEAAQVRAFCDRLDVLRPDVAVFLNDTQLRMGDKIAVLFADEMRRRAGPATAAAVVRLDGETFAVGRRLLITNSEPDLVGNLIACVARHFRGEIDPGDPRRDRVGT